MPKFQVLRSYIVTEVHYVEAPSAEEAEDRVSSETFHKAVDGEYLDVAEVHDVPSFPWEAV